MAKNLAVRAFHALAFLGAAALLPHPAYAADEMTRFVAPVLLLLGAAAIAGSLYYRLANRVSLLEAERARLAALVADRDALLAGAPLALVSWQGDEPRWFGAAGLPALAGIDSYAAFLAALEPADRTALQDDIARLLGDGTAFTFAGRLAGTTAILDVRGLRSTGPKGTVTLLAVTDASPRVAAEAQQAQLARMLDALPGPVWRRNADLALIACNRAYASAVDAPAETAIGEGRELAAGVVGQAGKALAAKARSGNKAESEICHIVVGGSRRLMELTEAPFGDGLIGWTRDLTDLESARAELARHIAAHDDVLENIAVAIAIYGPDTRLNFFNTAFARLWQLEEDFLGSQPTQDEVLERLRERRRLPEYADFRSFKRQQRAMFTSLIDPQEELLHLPDERTLRLVVGPHPFGGLIFAYEDVTDRLALERSYNTLIEVQRETLDNLYEGLAVFGTDGRLKLWNPTYAQIWQLTPEDLGGEPHVAEIIEKTRAFYDDGGDWAETKRSLIARLTSHGAQRTALERRDGTVLQAASVPLPDGNILLSYSDVTDSTRVEEALRERTEALETAGRLKSEFIANVSYELRTPLNAVIGFAEILTNQYFGTLNTRQLEYSRGILESSSRLLSLINDILDLATVEAGYMQLESQEVDVHALMSAVLTYTRERARNQGLRLLFDCPTDVGVIVADERRVKQALFNLVSNALKFTQAGGTVTLAARRDGDAVALVVADTGIGVAREDQERIFEKFERGNPQARQSGAGLGLSLVKSFIELHGGRVVLDSRPGSGTTVTCFLSAASAVTSETMKLRDAGE